MKPSEEILNHDKLSLFLLCMHTYKSSHYLIGIAVLGDYNENYISMKIVIIYLIVIISHFILLLVILSLYNRNILQGQSSQDTTQSILHKTHTTSSAELLLLYYHHNLCSYFNKIIFLIINMVP